MDTIKKHFIERANKIGILYVRERNCKEDLTGWGALEFTLNNGEIFVISNFQFGQGEGEDGLWVDINKVDINKLRKIELLLSKLRKEKKDNTISSWLKHQLFNIKKIS